MAEATNSLVSYSAASMRPVGDKLPDRGGLVLSEGSNGQGVSIDDFGKPSCVAESR